MKLLDEYSEEFAFMVKTKEPDGEGGLITTWTEGSTFRMALEHKTDIVAQQAEASKNASTYSFYVDKTIELGLYDVVKRKSDGATFRITQPTGEDYTPSFSKLNLYKVTAERWNLT